MRKGFWGGIHPEGRKELSRKEPPSHIDPPAQVVLPMLQHAGQEARPLVAAGDRVRLGQMIGDGEGLCVPIHASVSGVVTAVEKRRHPWGRQVTAVVIENDFQDTPAPPLPHGEVRGKELFSLLRQAGLVGMGGAAFPTDVKALSALGQIDTLIANACECEPYITADDALLCAHPERVADGMEVLRQALSPRRTVLAVEANKGEAIAVLERVLADHRDIELKVLPIRYPQGAERQLIQALTGRQVPPGGRPASVGCAMFNVATFASVHRAVRRGEPVTRRIVTVTGDGVARPQNFVVPIGTSFAHLIAAAGGLTAPAGKVISGGPMMGAAQGDLETPVLKATNAVLCLSGEMRIPERPVCIRCGRCVRACPMHLQPLYLYRCALRDDRDGLGAFHLSDCIQCGCCSYVCPGRLPLVERFHEAKRRGGRAS